MQRGLDLDGAEAQGVGLGQIKLHRLIMVYTVQSLERRRGPRKE